MPSFGTTCGKFTMTSAYIHADIWLDGGTHRSYHWKTSSQSLVVRPSSPSSVVSQPILVARERPTHSSISWPMALRSLLSSLTSLGQLCKLLSGRALRKQCRHT